VSARRPGFEELVARARRHLAAGQPTPAHEAAAAAVRLAPGAAVGWVILGRAVAGLGRHEEAAAILARAGELSASGGDLEPARQVLEEAAALAPGRWEPRFGLGQVLLAAGRIAEAREAFEAAAAGDPAAVPPRLMLGRLLERAGSPSEASARYREILAVQPGHPDALAELGFVEKLAGRYAESEALFRTALASRPDHAGGAMGLAGLLELKGEYEAALDALGPALSGASRDPALELVAARVERRARGPAVARERLLRLAAAHLPDARLRGRVLFQLAQVNDELERYEDAFRHAQEANELRRDRRWNAQAHSARVEGIILRWPPGAGEASGVLSELPLFVIGMPRSGTTLVEHLLASHPDVLPGGERNDVVALAATLPDSLPSRERVQAAAAG
jgi:tetratricopeptide (TPR) repeat protein